MWVSEERPGREGGGCVWVSEERPGRGASDGVREHDAPEGDIVDGVDRGWGRTERWKK